MVFRIFLVSLLNLILIYFFYFRAKVSKRTLIFSSLVFNIFFILVSTVVSYLAETFPGAALWILSLIVLGGFLLEVFCRLQLNLKTKPQTNHVNSSTYLNLKSFESYGPKFLEEIKVYKRKLLLEAEEYGFVKLLDNELSLITISNGRRVTVDQPHDFERSCYLLGGSTIFNAQVPNNMTISSQLQCKFNQIPIRVIVQNLGVSGATTVNRIKFLRESFELERNDVVVLYFGVNDICLPGSIDKSQKVGDLIIFSANAIMDVFRKRLQMFWWLRPLRKPRFKKSIEKYLTDTVIPSIVEFSNFCKVKNVKFIAVLQPSLFSTAELDDDAWRELAKLPGSLRGALEYGNLLFIKELSKYEFFVDGRSMLKDSAGRVFCDWVHTTDVGNAAIASFLFEELKLRGCL